MPQTTVCVPTFVVLALKAEGFVGANAPPSLREGLLFHKKGAIAQLGERVLCKHEVVGSIPSGSTNRRTDAGERRTGQA